MFILVAYDISDDRRRVRVSRLLEVWGQRVQLSVFELELTEGRLDQLSQRIARLLRPGDSIRYYPLCATCLRKTRPRTTGPSMPGLIII